MSDHIERANILVEEWKLLAGYVDRGFYSIEAQAIQVVMLVAAGIGVFESELSLPDNAWLFVAPAIFALMLRMKSQAAFTFFQADRITAIEDEINQILKTEENHRVFFYAHRVADLSKTLGTKGMLYPYPAWTIFLDILGATLVLYSTYRATSFLSENAAWAWAAWPFATFFVLAVVWYGAATATILYRFFNAVEGHPKQCLLDSAKDT